MPKSGKCPRCGNTVRQDNTDWVCTACSRRWPIPAELIPQPRPMAPPDPAKLSVNRCLICAMPAEAGQAICQDPECRQYVSGYCLYCNAEIVAQSSTGQHQKFCSRICASAWHSAQRSTRRYAAHIDRPRRCVRCGNLIPLPPEGYRGRPKSYCSKSCILANRTKQIAKAGTTSQ